MISCDEMIREKACWSEGLPTPKIFPMEHEGESAWSLLCRGVMSCRSSEEVEGVSGTNLAYEYKTGFPKSSSSSRSITTRVVGVESGGRSSDTDTSVLKVFIWPLLER